MFHGFLKGVWGTLRHRIKDFVKREVCEHRREQTEKQELQCASTDCVLPGIQV